MMSHDIVVRVMFAVSVALVLGACGEAGVEETGVPGGTGPISERGTPPGTPPGTAEAGADAEPWVVPEGWTRAPGERPMRLATFLIPDETVPVEVAVTRFPGDVGGVLANLNRWRGQMGLAPVTENELPDHIERFEAPGFAGYTARVRGEPTHMFTVGVHDLAADHTWFVRIAGEPDTVDRVRDEVLAFARSIMGVD